MPSEIYPKSAECTLCRFPLYLEIPHFGPRNIIQTYLAHPQKHAPRQIWRTNREIWRTELIFQKSRLRIPTSRLTIQTFRPTKPRPREIYRKSAQISDIFPPDPTLHTGPHTWRHTSKDLRTLTVSTQSESNDEIPINAALTRSR